MNSLPKTVTRQRRDCDLNPDPSAPAFSTLTTRLPSHPLRAVPCSNSVGVTCSNTQQHIAKFHYTGPTRTRTRTFLQRNSVGSVRVRFAAKKSVSACRARVRVRVVEFSPYAAYTCAASSLLVLLVLQVATRARTTMAGVRTSARL